MRAGDLNSGLGACRAVTWLTVLSPQPPFPYFLILLDWQFRGENIVFQHYLLISRKCSMLFPSQFSLCDWSFFVLWVSVLCFVISVSLFPSLLCRFQFYILFPRNISIWKIFFILFWSFLCLMFSFCAEGLPPQHLAQVCIARFFAGSSQEVVPSVSWTAAFGDSISLPQWMISSDAA